MSDPVFEPLGNGAVRRRQTKGKAATLACRIAYALIILFTVVAAPAARAQILNHDSLLHQQTWWDNRDWDWYKARIPFFDSPDSAINTTYYYRWQLITRHLTYGSPETGYTFTEFIDRPFWSGAYGGISCPLGHQMAEVRWLNDPRIVDDFARYWFETPGAQPRSYSNWYAAAVWGTYQVNGDSAFLRRMYPHMLEQYRGWVAEHYDSTKGMFHWDGLHDGMEYNINSRQTAEPGDGADGFRPTLNSYLFADERAIAKTAALLHQPDTARAFDARAAVLKQRVQRELWDSTRHFFLAEFAHDEKDGITAGSRTYQTGPHAGDPHGREEIGFVPWQFDLPDPGYEAAWQYLMDTSYFAAPYGPTTTERHDPLFYVSPRCCWWSGNSWPYATSQTLVALANVLHDYHQSYVSKNDYYDLLRTYTLTQRKDGKPYIAEAANPFTGSWDGHNTFDHSENYFHSQYVNLIITGLVGLIPRDDDTLEVAPLAPDAWTWFALDDVHYHGHTVAIVWDKDGSHYHRGAGFTALVDGQTLARRPTLGRLTAVLPPALSAPSAPSAPSVNVAVNNDGKPFPLVTASYSAPATPPFYMNDGNVWYDTVPPNRWTAVGSGHATDWVQVDFGIERPVEQVTLYFLDDGAGILAPQRYQLERWTGSSWAAIAGQQRSPEAPEGHRPNTVSFPVVHTSRLRVVLTHRPGTSSGLTEFEAWNHAALPLAVPTAPSPDLALNTAGTGFPEATASFTSRYDRVAQVNDGRIAFNHYSRNRWTAYGSPNPSDWVEIDFGARRTVSALDLYLWGDGGGTRAPRSYSVQYWDGRQWADAAVESRTPEIPATSAMNTVRIRAVATDKVRVTFVHALPAFTGVTEIRIWGGQP